MRFQYSIAVHLPVEIVTEFEWVELGVVNTNPLHNAAHEYINNS